MDDGYGEPGKGAYLYVGHDPATAFPAALVGDHEAYIDSLFNRNGKSCRELYKRMRGDKGPSQTRKNIDALRERLASLGVNDVMETNVICLAAPKSKDDRAIGGKVFIEILWIIRPIVLIAHGAGTIEELRRVLCPKLPAAAKKPVDGVSRKHVHTQLRGEPYAPMVFVIRSLAPPEWNKWQNWAQPHLAKTCKQARQFLDDHLRYPCR